MISDDLIEAAELLLAVNSGQPKQAMLKRAVSTAYYALFHALAHTNVDALLGWRMQSPRYWEIVTPVYRLIEHGAAKQAFDKLARVHPTEDVFIKIGSAFAELQKQRMTADYDPKPSFTLSGVRELIAVAQEAVGDVRSLKRDDRRLLASYLIAKRRPGS